MEQRLQALDAGQRAAVWSQRIADCRSSGMTVRAWCREQDLSEKAYYYWQHRIFKALIEQPVFAEISIGFCASAGISQISPFFIAPGILSEVQ